MWGLQNSPLGVKGTLLLEHLGNNGDSRVDGVGNDQDEGLGRVLGDSYGNVTNNAGVDLCTHACDWENNPTPKNRKAASVTQWGSAGRGGTCVTSPKCWGR